MMLRTAILMILAAGTLAGCGDSAPTPAATDDASAGAKGEVIGGTISDAMLPLDRLRSQSPPLSEERAAGSTGASPAPAPAPAAPDEAAAPSEPEEPAAD